jgi:uncharacterized protein (DUF885 family)
MKIFAFLSSVFFSLQVNAAQPASTAFCKAIAKTVNKGNAEQKLNAFLKAQWDYTMTEYPEYATYVGYPGQNDRWTDHSLAAIERRKGETACQLAVLNKIPFKNLKNEARINFDLAKKRLDLAAEGDQFAGEYLVLDQLGGLHTDVVDLLQAMPAANKHDYENMLRRLEQIPLVEEQTEVLLREGLKKRVTAVKMFLAKVPMQFDRLLTTKIEDGPIFKPFSEINVSVSAQDRTELQDRARRVITEKVYPALKKLRGFVITDYIPGARESISIADLPNGKAWYMHRVRQETTTDMTPEQLHDLGLKEVERISKEMERVKEQVSFHGDLLAFNKFLLKDKQFYYTDKDDLLAGYRSIAKRIDPELPKLFKTLPRLTYGVREMPAYKAVDAPGAYYIGGSLKAGRAGYFEANTTDLPGRPKWGMEALTLHEAVPGHHLQISIAQELPELPEFRKQEGYTAFVEGWGLYAESLGGELGLYKDPYSKYGQLSYEMWRAIRLVVDTGIHAKGWTREAALDYFAQHMPKAKAETENEVDRYITWPAQALAYKVGELKFRELRRLAESELGENFDIREFHDQLLKHGGLPMDVLEKNIRDWLALQKKTDKPKQRVAG